MKESIGQIARKLVELEAKGKADAWDEGYCAALEYAEQLTFWKLAGGPEPSKRDNPYRRGS